MILQSIEYSEYIGEPNEWKLSGLTLDSVNLLVGKNATGKTRSLNILVGIANLLSGERKPSSIKSGMFNAIFSHEGDSPRYKLVIHDNKVQSELFTIRGKNVLDRTDGGKGQIFAAKEKEYRDFQTPESDLAVVARRDSLQHPDFELLHGWGSALHHYLFGEDLGKKMFAMNESNNLENLNTKDARQVVGIFQKGKQRYGQEFTDAIMKDMTDIGYPNTGVGVVTPSHIPSTPESLVGLFLKESDLNGKTEQIMMSQGMFRALSIIIQLNYSYLASSPSCILIDDIGEGLDFERSSALIKLLVKNAEIAHVQLIMTTNDRFIMNNVPLEMWSVLQRQGGDTQVFNVSNSKGKFDEFKFTGLNNFDFLAMDFLNEENQPDE